MAFSTLDIVLFAIYIVLTMVMGLWIGSRKRGGSESAADYFLADKSIPWWAVGGSLIASNISAEQMIGMSGSGYAVGMAIASYELMAAFALLIIAKYFLPIYINKGIYTMPQFLEQRFGHGVRTGLALFWIGLFVLVNITSVLYLGALAIRTMLGIPLLYGIIGLAIYSAAFSILGGLRTVVWSEVVQVIVLIFGGFMASYLVLNQVSDGEGFFAGLNTLVEKAPEKFDMILDKSNPEYINLPGISVLIGGLWIANLYYWGNNQYIIQRALAAKNIKEAQRGMAFAGFLKVLLPIIVVVPGIAAYVLGADIIKPDEAFPWVLSNYVTAGFKGIVFAALVAAVGSSVSAMVNSTSTIFTLDIYKNYLTKDPSDKNLVRVGKIASTLALVIGTALAPTLSSLDQAFQYIQEYTGFISPGVVVVFLFGMFWKKASNRAALWVVILSIPLSAAIKFLAPDFPFMDRMGVCFLVLAAILVAISYIDNGKENDVNAIKLSKDIFKTGWVFNFASLVILIILAFVYIKFW
ncbi:sodium/sugar symporter [Membranihabitans maritimus]|uniref:sodium/sugar symporter n=1 Tax=Membranihabitans maritimus TaxID=2904244 RepID=UPI001F3AA096|nr:sodium/sugar symporter [Membranihabitans maritimus]